MRIDRFRRCGVARRAVAWVGRLLAPGQCPSCRGRIASSGGLCAACARRLRREQRGTASFRLRMQGPCGISHLRVVSAGRHRGVWARVIRAYKSDPSQGMSLLLAEILVQALGPQSAADHSVGGAGPVLLPVPMAPVRRRERGCNPPERLAHHLSGRLGWACRPEALVRRRYRRPLRGLGLADRRAEVAGAFVPGPDAATLRGRTVVLVDDVVTTGSTLRAAAEALGLAGVKTTTAWTLGRRPRRRSKNRAARRSP